MARWVKRPRDGSAGASLVAYPAWRIPVDWGGLFPAASLVLAPLRVLRFPGGLIGPPPGTYPAPRNPVDRADLSPAVSPALAPLRAPRFLGGSVGLYPGTCPVPRFPTGTAGLHPSVRAAHWERFRPGDSVRRSARRQAPAALH